MKFEKYYAEGPPGHGKTETLITAMTGKITDKELKQELGLSEDEIKAYREGLRNNSLIYIALTHETDQNTSDKFIKVQDFLRFLDLYAEVKNIYTYITRPNDIGQFLERAQFLEYLKRTNQEGFFTKLDQIFSRPVKIVIDDANIVLAQGSLPTINFGYTINQMSMTNSIFLLSSWKDFKEEFHKVEFRKSHYFKPVSRSDIAEAINKIVKTYNVFPEGPDGRRCQAAIDQWNKFVPFLCQNLSNMRQAVEGVLGLRKTDLKFVHRFLGYQQKPTDKEIETILPYYGCNPFQEIIKNPPKQLINQEFVRYVKLNFILLMAKRIQEVANRMPATTVRGDNVLSFVCRDLFPRDITQVNLRTDDRVNLSKSQVLYGFQFYSLLTLRAYEIFRKIKEQSKVLQYLEIQKIASKRQTHLITYDKKKPRVPKPSLIQPKTDYPLRQYVESLNPELFRFCYNPFRKDESTEYK